MSPAVRSGFKGTENMVQWKNNWIALAPKVLNGSTDKVPGSNMRAGPSLKVSVFSFRGLEYVGIVKRYCYVYCFAQCMSVYHYYTQMRMLQVLPRSGCCSVFCRPSSSARLGETKTVE